jgi:hypothetical protein
MVRGWQMTPPHRDQVTAGLARGRPPAAAAPARCTPRSGHGPPDAIAGPIVFLISDAAAPLSGAILPAAGVRARTRHTHRAGRTKASSRLVCACRWIVTPTQARNHPDPVTATHLAGGEPGPHRESSHGRQGRAPRSAGDTMTSPASGAGSAPDLPDYAPTIRSAQSETRLTVSPDATAGGGRLGLAGVGGERLRGHLRWPAAARRPRR